MIFNQLRLRWFSFSLFPIGERKKEKKGRGENDLNLVLTIGVCFVQFLKEVLPNSLLGLCDI